MSMYYIKLDSTSEFGRVYSDGHIYYEPEKEFYRFDTGKVCDTEPDKRVKIKFRLRLDKKIQPGYYLKPIFKLVVIPNKAAFVTITSYENYLSEEEYCNTVENIEIEYSKIYVNFKYSGKSKAYCFCFKEDRQVIQEKYNTPEIISAMERYLKEEAEKKERDAANLKVNEALAEKINTQVREWLEVNSTNVTDTQELVEIRIITYADDDGVSEKLRREPEFIEMMGRSERYAYWYNGLPAVETECEIVQFTAYPHINQYYQIFDINYKVKANVKGVYVLGMVGEVYVTSAQEVIDIIKNKVTDTKNILKIREYFVGVKLLTTVARKINNVWQ